MARLSIFAKGLDKALCSSRTETAKNKSYSAWMWILTFFSYLCYHMCRKPISVVQSVLHSENCTDVNASLPCWPPFDTDSFNQILGNVDASWAWAYAVGMFISGYIADRVDLRLYLGIGMILSAASCSMFGFGFYFGSKGIGLWFYVIAMVLSGMFQSTGWPSVVAALGNWFGKGNRGLIMGIWNCHTSFGNIAGTTLAGLFVSYNWGLSFIVPSIIMASVGVIVLMFLVPEPTLVGLPNPNKVEEPAICIIQETPEEEDKAISIFAALKIPGVIEFSLCLFFAKLVAYTFLFWLPMYINAKTDFDAASSAYLSTMFDFGGAVGAVAAGIFLDKTGLPAISCSILLALSIPAMMCYLAFAAFSMGLNIFLLLIMGFLVNGPYALITTAISAELGTHESLRGNAKALATVTAIIDGTGSVGSAIGPWIAGPLSDEDWDYVFYMLIVAALMALLLLSRLIYHEAQTVRRRYRQRALSTA